jgi:hypothetical protein
MLSKWQSYALKHTKAFARDNPNATVHLIDAGHFALETQVVTVAEIMRGFLAG